MKLIRSFLLPLIVLITGVSITWMMLKTAPQAKPRPRKKNIPLVETSTIECGTFPTSIQAMGVVQAAQYIDLKPQVSGQIITMADSLVPGGHFHTGDTLLQIDPRDYRLKVDQERSAVSQAKSDLALEEGNQLVAKREFALLNERVTAVEKNLMLRQPQLQSLKTALAIALAKEEQAKLNLQRTTIKAPFNGIVQERNINIGAMVSSTTTMATLVGSDQYWVEVSVPEEQLQWIIVPGQNRSDRTGSGTDAETSSGSKVTIYNPTAWGQEKTRTGHVIQVLPSLESQGRMARILVELADPLALDPTNEQEPRLLIGSFVRVEINGAPLSDTCRLSRDYLRDGNNLWVMNSQSQLDIRPVNITFKNQDTVLISNALQQGETIITSSLPTPIAGMRINRQEDLRTMENTQDQVQRPGNE